MAVFTCALAFALIAGCVDATAVARVSPELRPESHEKFEKDYRVDAKPVASDHSFGLPYPAAQNTKAFSADFVKDENGDNGQWKAQMKYDALRQKVRKGEAAAQKAFDAKQKEMKELEAAQDKLKAAEEKVAESKKDVESAIAKEDRYVVEHKEISNWGEEEKSDAIEKATERVNKEMAEFEKCKQELENAKAKLQKLEQEAAEAKAKGKSEGEETKSETAKELESAEEKLVAAERAAEDLKRKEDELVKREAKLGKAVEEEKSEHDKATQEHAKAQKDLDVTSAKVADAEERLRRLRGEPAPREPKDAVSDLKVKKVKDLRGVAADWAAALIGATLTAAICMVFCYCCPP